MHYVLLPPWQITSPLPPLMIQFRANGNVSSFWLKRSNNYKKKSEFLNAVGCSPLFFMDSLYSAASYFDLRHPFVMPGMNNRLKKLSFSFFLVLLWPQKYPVDHKNSREIRSNPNLKVVSHFKLRRLKLPSSGERKENAFLIFGPFPS